ncbi:histidinol phosphatase [Wenyingzhuangia sp. 1_MG-2023]|nr:histidinol phosphatase [Wenyingzhuangia sp. 1_MG-2023]
MSFFDKKIKPSELFPPGFVDIHSHLLPGIDDGAKNIETSIEIIQKMQALGISNFRTTPHVLGGVWENSSTTIKEKEALLKTELKAKGMDSIQLYASAEYMMDDYFYNLLMKNDIIPLKDNYLLVEMSFLNPPFNLSDIIFQIQVKGYKPVLAHPERYIYYHDDFSKYEKLIAAGCLFQLNLYALANHYGKGVTKVAMQLLKKGMYTYVGTDTHHLRHLYAIEKIATQKNKKLLSPLFENTIRDFSF